MANQQQNGFEKQQVEFLNQQSVKLRMLQLLENQHRLFKTLTILIHYPCYTINEEVLHCVFEGYGAIEILHIDHVGDSIKASIQFQSQEKAMAAKNNLQGRYIYTGSCQLSMELAAEATYRDVQVELIALRAQLMKHQNITNRLEDDNVAAPVEVESASTKRHLRDMDFDVQSLSSEMDKSTSSELEEKQLPAPGLFDKSPESPNHLNHLTTKPPKPPDPYSTGHYLLPKTLETTTLNQNSNVLRVSIYYACYPITEEVLHNIFAAYGSIEVLRIDPVHEAIIAIIQFQSHNNAMAARNALQGRCIYTGCCHLSIEFAAEHKDVGTSHIQGIFSLDSSAANIGCIPESMDVNLNVESTISDMDKSTFSEHEEKQLSAHELFDKRPEGDIIDGPAALEGDSQGVEHLHGVVSAHMWHGMVLNSDDYDNEAMKVIYGDLDVKPFYASQVFDESLYKEDKNHVVAEQISYDAQDDEDAYEGIVNMASNEEVGYEVNVVSEDFNASWNQSFDPGISGRKLDDSIGMESMCNSVTSILEMSKYESTLDANTVPTVAVEGNSAKLMPFYGMSWSEPNMLIVNCTPVNLNENENLVFDELPQKDKHYHSYDLQELNNDFNGVSDNLAATESLDAHWFISELEKTDFNRQVVQKFRKAIVFDQMSISDEDDAPTNKQVVYDEYDSDEADQWFQKEGELTTFDQLYQAKAEWLKSTKTEMKREELILFAKVAITGFKLKTDLRRIDIEASVLKRRLDELRATTKEPNEFTIDDLKESVSHIKFHDDMQGHIVEPESPISLGLEDITSMCPWDPGIDTQLKFFPAKTTKGTFVVPKEKNETSSDSESDEDTHSSDEDIPTKEGFVAAVKKEESNDDYEDDSSEESGDADWRYTSMKLGKVRLEKPIHWTCDKFAAENYKEYLNLFPMHARPQNITHSAKMLVKTRLQVYRPISSDKLKTGRDNLMDAPDEGISLFDHVTCYMSTSVDKVTTGGSLTLNLVEQAETRVEGIDQQKASKMKEIAFKRQAELEQIFAHAHIEIDSEAAHKKIMSLIDSSNVEPAKLLTDMDLQIMNANEEALSRTEILGMVEMDTINLEPGSDTRITKLLLVHGLCFSYKLKAHGVAMDRDVYTHPWDPGITYLGTSMLLAEGSVMALEDKDLKGEWNVMSVRQGQELDHSSQRTNW